MHARGDDLPISMVMPGACPVRLTALHLFGSDIVIVANLLGGSDAVYLVLCPNAPTSEASCKCSAHSRADENDRRVRLLLCVDESLLAATRVVRGPMSA